VLRQLSQDPLKIRERSLAAPTVQQEEPRTQAHFILGTHSMPARLNGKNTAFGARDRSRTHVAVVRQHKLAKYARANTVIPGTQSSAALHGNHGGRMNGRRCCRPRPHHGCRSVETPRDLKLNVECLGDVAQTLFYLQTAGAPSTQFVNASKYERYRIGTAPGSRPTYRPSCCTVGKIRPL
jgi:hypothetical protein